MTLTDKIDKLGACYVGIGKVTIARSPVRLTTVLGSCVALTLYCPGEQVGGMAHILLSGDGGGNSTRFSDPAVKQLLGEVRGKSPGKSRLIAKVIGGARSFFSDDGAMIRNIGRNTVLGVVRYLVDEDIDIEGMHIGGTSSRDVMFDLETGDVIIRVKKVNNMKDVLVVV